MMRFLLPICALTVCMAMMVLAQESPQTHELQRQSQELAQKRQELLEKQIEILTRQLEIQKQRSPQSKAVSAMQAILDLKLSQERVKSALIGGQIIADDGTFIGMIGPTYDTNSIFCSYGPYGASYSTNSIWCNYGPYGASYSELSPFCSYSTTPPKIIVDGTVVASLTVGWLGFPVSVSPDALKAVFVEE